MSKLELILLGRFECLLSTGRRVTLSMRKAEVLLAFLALAPGLRHPRERLINLLWSDRGEEQARNSLRQCLSAIRKSLGEAADMVLQIDRTTVCLNAELIDIDVHEFERLADSGDYESLLTAADLYQGDFLEGISIRDAASQEWLDGERARFKRQFVEILHRLAETQFLSHDYDHAVRSAERLVEQDPLDEAGWRLLMQSHAALGNRNHALKVFKRCQQTLQQELGIDPESTTVELRERIAAGDADQPAAAPKPRVSTDADRRETRAGEHSIAVLPFDNLSGDPQREYFSDGITESIIFNLALFPGLHVKSRHSSFAFKQQLKGLAEISRELEVDYIVEGSVRRSKDRVRITTQLIDAANGNQVWGKRYDAEMAGLFDLEEELSRSIAATVTGRIQSELQRIALAKGAAGQDSYDLLLSGTYHAHLFTRRDTAIAIEKLNQCLQKDPHNVRAHKQLYTCHLMNYLDRWTEDHLASFDCAAEHIGKAMALAPESDTVQIFYAQYLVFCGEFEQADKYLHKALEINPNNTDALTTLALSLEIQGKAKPALEAAEHSCRLDPYHPWAEWEVAVSLFVAGKLEAVSETISRMRTSPGFIRIFGIAAWVRLGNMKDAGRELRAFVQECEENMLAMPRSRDEWLQYTRENYPFADARINEEIVDDLMRAGLEDQLDPPKPTPRTPAAQSSIAVLPFDNLSGDPEQEYFSDGITDSIIMNLALFPDLSIKSRNSSFAFKQQIKSLGEISHELGVDYIVEGSVRRSTGRIRVNVQLIEAASGNQVWGKRYDSDLEDLFELEEDLCRSVAATVTGKIESELQRIALAKGASDQQAYDLLLAGIYHLQRANRKDNAIAIEKLNACLERDPDNARAHAWLYDCHHFSVMDRWSDDLDQSRQLAVRHIQRAVELAPEQKTVRLSYIDYLTFQHRYDEAETQVQRALAMNPNEAGAYAARAVNLSSMGQWPEAVEAAEIALRLDPYNYWGMWILAEALFFCDRYEECLETIARTDNAPGFVLVYSVAANIELGRREAARKSLDQFVEFCADNMLTPPASIDEWRQYFLDNAPFADSSVNERILKLLLDAGLEIKMSDSSSAQQKSDAGMSSIAVLPFDNLSGDPEQEYFSDGITESIILNLALFPDLHIKSRNSSFAFKQQLKGLAEISRELDVDYIVEGSVRKSKDRIRITVQLVEAASGNQLWGKRYDSDLADLFELEEELSRAIAATVTGRIQSELQRIAISSGAAGQESYDLLLAGIYNFHRFDREGMVIAIDKANQCLEQDPDNVRAHELLYGAHGMNYLGRWSEDHQESFRLAGKHIRRALELGPELAVVQAFFAEYSVFCGEFETAHKHLDKALEINPNDPSALVTRAMCLNTECEFEAALAMADRAIRLDPYHPWAEWEPVVSLSMLKRHEEALKAFDNLRTSPGFTHVFRVVALVGLGRSDQARKALQEFLHECRETMLSMPQTVDEWYLYTRENYSFVDERLNREIIDCLRQAGLEEALALRPAEAQTEQLPSVLVLPFGNLSGDPEQEYFSDGITDSVIVNLSAFPGIRVKSRHASFAFKDSQRDIDEFVAELGVQYVVDGHIRKAAGKVRVTAQLSETASGHQVWGKRFDYDIDDLFALEEELSMTIAGSISARIGKDARLSALHKPAKDLQSYDYYMRGSYHLELFNAENIGIAMEQLEKCLQLDPANSLAHAKLAIAHMVALYENCAADRDTSLELMDEHLQRALELNPDDAEAHAFMAEMLMYQRDFDRALVHARKAVDLNPTLADGYSMLAWHAGSVGKLEEARAWAEKSMHTDIHHPYAGWNAGEIYRLCGDYELAIETFRSMAHMSSTVQAQIAACLAGLNRIDEARAEMRRFLDLAQEQMVVMPASRDEWYDFWWESMPYKHKADNDRFFELLELAGLCELKV